MFKELNRSVINPFESFYYILVVYKSCIIIGITSAKLISILTIPLDGIFKGIRRDGTCGKVMFL